MPTVEQSKPGIPEPQIPDRPLQISFKHLECDAEKYSLTKCSSEYWTLLARELKRYASFSVGQFEYPEHEDARHMIAPDDEGIDMTPLIPVMNQFEWAPAWQFGLGHRGKGLRVVGILVDPIFFVIRLDADHETYTEASSKGW